MQAESISAGEQLTSNRQGAPSIGQSAPSIGQGAPSIGQGAPSIGQGAPSIGQGAPSIGQLTSSSHGLNCSSIITSKPSNSKQPPLSVMDGAIESIVRLTMARMRVQRSAELSGCSGCSDRKRLIDHLPDEGGNQRLIDHLPNEGGNQRLIDLLPDEGGNQRPSAPHGPLTASRADARVLGLMRDAIRGHQGSYSQPRRRSSAC